MYNAVNAVKAELVKHKVNFVSDEINPGSDCYLIIVSLQISLYDEFLAAFGESLAKLANKAFGKKAVWCDYGVFLDDKFNCIFAFNTLFANFDLESGQVVYKDQQDILSDAMSGDLASDDLGDRPSLPDFDPDPDAGGILVKYGIPGGVFNPGPGSFFRPRRNVRFKYALPDPSDEDAPAPNQG